MNTFLPPTTEEDIIRQRELTAWKFCRPGRLQTRGAKTHVVVLIDDGMVRAICDSKLTEHWAFLAEPAAGWSEVNCGHCLPRLRQHVLDSLQS